MELHAIICIASATFILFAILAFCVCVILLRRCRIPNCFPRFWDSEDIELGRNSTARVADSLETEISKPLPANKDATTAATFPRNFAWPEIESSTSNFTSVIIGKGGFSTVYLARFPDCSFAAVKLHHSCERLHRAFRQELDVLLRLQHPYIVRLLGYCDEKDDQGVLVFEHVSNGNLRDKLRSSESATVVLPWMRRTSIAYRIAKAIVYLHDGNELHIVHGDVKAENVLLDEDFNPKLCDFGCARTGFAAVFRSPPAMTGSPGYVDPHYIRTGIFSKKSDVYSFGVLLLELITGGEAFDFETERMLTASMAPVLLDTARWRVKEIVDQRLAAEYDVAEAAVLTSLAASCLRENPSRRPSMAEIVREMGEKVPSSVSAVD